MQLLPGIELLYENKYISAHNYYVLTLDIITTRGSHPLRKEVLYHHPQTWQQTNTQNISKIKQSFFCKKVNVNSLETNFVMPYTE